MKKTASRVLSSAIVLSSLFFYSLTTEAQGTEDNKTEKVLYEKNEETNLSKAVEKEYKNIKIQNEVITEPNIDVDAIIEHKDNENSIDVEKQATQLLKVSENEDGDLRAEYVTVVDAVFDEELINSNNTTKLLNDGDISILSKPIGSKTGESWVSGIHGFVKVYYHKDYKKGYSGDSYDMNKIQVWWTTNGSGGIVSNRKATMQQTGKTHWGSRAVTHSKTKEPKKNSKTEYDVPDSWEPIWEGIVCGRSSARVKNIKTGKTYTLKVEMRIL